MTDQQRLFFTSHKVEEANGARLFLGESQKSLVGRASRTSNVLTFARLFGVHVETADFLAGCDLEYTSRKRVPLLDFFRLGEKLVEVSRNDQILAAWRKEDRGFVAFRAPERSCGLKFFLYLAGSSVVQRDAVPFVCPGNIAAVRGQHRMIADDIERLEPAGLLARLRIVQANPFRFIFEIHPVPKHYPVRILRN